MSFEPALLAQFGQLFLAALLGAILGTERIIAGKHAGMRTYALVALGACLFIAISTAGTSGYLGKTNFDPMRMAAAIVTGIGFIGAGLIIFKETKLKGLTTAAGLWVAAGIGMAVGFGQYMLAIFATALTLFVFTGLWLFEERVRAYGSYQTQAVVEGTEDDTDD